MKKVNLSNDSTKSIDFYEGRMPSQVTDFPWVFATNRKIAYKPSTERSGKWLVFVNKAQIDQWWEKLKVALHDGLLGKSMKVSTMMESSLSSGASKSVIVIYTYDSEDEQDVMRIREILRALGVTWRIPYKTDKATHDGQYRVTGQTRISRYYC